MNAIALPRNRQGILRYSRWDALLTFLAVGQGLLLVTFPSAAVIALGLWWNSNTISHCFLHSPFFQSRALNRGFALYLSLLLGVPQTLWRERHLAHHAGTIWRLRLTRPLLVEVVLIAGLWTALLIANPAFFLTAYLPGYAIGLAICALHGYYEHACETTSHYGWFYNCLFFNDGLHVEHHAHPGTHWTRLPEQLQRGAHASRWPAVIRWLDELSLEGLERRVLRSERLQHFILSRHERAFRKLLPRLPPVRQVGIIGGALFPRTALICRRLLPSADVFVIDANAENIATARSFVPEGVEFVHAWYDPECHNHFDLLVFPLAYIGDRQAAYRHPPAPAVLVHDWVWRRHRPGAVVSFLLFKRMNLVIR